MSTSTIFETPRCRIRPWQRREAPRFLEIYSQWDVVRWLGADPRPCQDLAEAEKTIGAWQELHAADRSHGPWAIERISDERVIGTLVWLPLRDGDGELEVGWHLDPEAWGGGYATEAARAALDWGFKGGVDEVYAVVIPGNTASAAVCTRLGMSHLGATDRYYGGTLLELFRVGRERHHGLTPAGGSPG